jgi:hypothetical protein
VNEKVFKKIIRTHAENFYLDKKHIARVATSPAKNTASLKGESLFFKETINW